MPEPSGDPVGAVLRPEVLARLRRTAVLLAGEPALGEDLLQTALTACWLQWRRGGPVDEPEAYVKAVLARTASRWWRRKWRGEVPTDVLPDRGQVTDGYAALETRQVLQRALAALPARQRAAVVLRVVEDWSEAEVAAALGCPVGSVKSATSRGLARLRSLPELSALVPSEVP